jgi:hypothetical protein
VGKTIINNPRFEYFSWFIPPNYGDFGDCLLMFIIVFTALDGRVSS